MSEQNLVESALAAGVELTQLKALGAIHHVGEGGMPFTFVPRGMALTPLDAHLAHPRRVRSAVRTDDGASFIAYINRHKTAHTTVFADLAGRKFEAVLDYHQAGGPAEWGTHRVTLACKTTDDWNAWVEASGKPKSQIDFARFIEDHIPNIAQPSGNELLLMATTLEAKKDVQFRSSTRLQNGEHQIRFEETIEGRAGGSQQGSLQIPNEFILGLEPFQGVGFKRVDARFRYRIGNGTLQLWFELIRPAEVLEKAFADVVTQIRTGLGDTQVLFGAAPTSA